ncbi:MAG: hypothetical protein JWM57_1383, partial [Phycisphaerales bacterium]|nr:hypothetical protein [Phycisphaerales bacterium]
MSENSVEPAGLRARLLDVEPPDGERLKQLQDEVQNMYFEELNRSSRVSWIVTLVISLVAAVFGAVIAVKINVPDSVASQGL